MLTVNKNLTTLHDETTLVTEASTLQINRWPQFISVVDEEGKGFLFGKERITAELGTYTTKDGRYVLKVFND